MKIVSTYDKLIITQFETTGLLSNVHEIIEIGAICCDSESLEILWEFETKVKPRNITVAQTEMLSVNGYNEAELANAPFLQEGFGAYYFRLDHTMIFTAQNVLFYYDFYRATITYQRLRDRLDPTPYGYNYHRLDIASMAYPFLNPPVYRISQIAPAFGVEPEPIPHRAIHRARKEYQLLKEIMHRGSEWRWTYQEPFASVGARDIPQDPSLSSPLKHGAR